MVGKTEEVYNVLKAKIISLELAPGSAITNSLLEELNVSRTPMREALQQLEREGFVVVNSRKNTLVSEITRELISNVFEVRYDVEPYIAKTFYKNIDLEEVHKNREILKTFYNNSYGRQYFIDVDNIIHNMILKACTNSFFFELMTRVNDHSSRIRQFISMRNDQYERSVIQHQAILEAIELGDPDAIEAAVRYHVIWSREDAYIYMERAEL